MDSDKRTLWERTQPGPLNHRQTCLRGQLPSLPIAATLLSEVALLLALSNDAKLKVDGDSLMLASRSFLVSNNRRGTKAFKSFSHELSSNSSSVEYLLYSSMSVTTTETIAPPAIQSQDKYKFENLKPYEHPPDTKADLRWSELVTLDLEDYNKPEGKERLAKQLEVSSGIQTASKTSRCYLLRCKTRIDYPPLIFYSTPYTMLASSMSRTLGSRKKMLIISLR